MISYQQTAFMVEEIKLKVRTLEDFFNHEFKLIIDHPAFADAEIESVTAWGKFMVVLKVDNFSEMIPALEAVEEILGVEIISSLAVPINEHVYYVPACYEGIFEVVASVRNRGEGCQRVHKGYRKEPIYEFICPGDEDDGTIQADND